MISCKSPSVAVVVKGRLQSGPPSVTPWRIGYITHVTAAWGHVTVVACRQQTWRPHFDKHGGPHNDRRSTPEWNRQNYNGTVENNYVFWVCRLVTAICRYGVRGRRRARFTLLELLKRRSASDWPPLPGRSNSVYSTMELFMVGIIITIIGAGDGIARPLEQNNHYLLHHRCLVTSWRPRLEYRYCYRVLPFWRRLSVGSKSKHVLIYVRHTFAYSEFNNGCSSPCNWAAVLFVFGLVC